MRRVVALSPFFLFASLLSAQTPSAPVRVPGETIVVTADRTAEPIGETTDSVSVITQADLQRSQVTTVAEALREVAGISIIQSGSPGHATSAFLRGANPAQLLILVDGVEINNPFFGGVDISSLLTSGIDRIEIVRGAQSPLYGSQAMSGVINIVTMPPEGAASGVRATLRAEGGSLSSHDELLQLTGGSDALQWKAGGSNLGTAGQFTNDEFRDVQLNALARWNLAPGSALDFHALGGHSHIGIPFNGITPSPRRDSGTDLAAGGVDYTRHASPLLNLEVRTGVTYRDDDFKDPDDPFSKASNDRSTLWRATAQNSMLLGAQTVTFGLEQKNEDVRATADGQVALDETIRTTAGYAQDKIELGALLLTAGARLDHHSRFGNHVSPRISAAYELSRGWRVRAAAGSAFRAPSAGELAYPFYGNPALDPETSRSYEAGADFKMSRAAFGLTGFSNKYRDLISFDPVTFIAANIDRATTRGAELTAGARLSDTWRADAAYTHVNTRDEGTGLPLYRRPRNVGALTLSYTRAAWTLSANANAIGRRLERDFETFTNRFNGGYIKTDLAGSYRVRSSLLLTARIENAMDRRYEEALTFRAPGRTFHAGVQYGF